MGSGAPPNPLEPAVAPPNPTVSTGQGIPSALAQGCRGHDRGFLQLLGTPRMVSPSLSGCGGTLCPAATAL